MKRKKKKNIYVEGSGGDEKVRVEKGWKKCKY